MERLRFRTWNLNENGDLVIGISAIMNYEAMNMINLKDKKILVTGGGGFLGTHVVQKLKARGVPEGHIRVPRAEASDLRKFEACEEAVRGMDMVIHLAGVTGDAEFHRAHPAQIFYDNLSMGIQLMEAARRAGIEKFLVAGSATEYPENAPLPFREENLWIGPFAKLHAPYTVVKKMLGVQTEAYRAQYGFNGIHLLFTNMYGPGKEAVRGFVITNIIRRIMDAQQAGADFIEVWGTGKAMRDFLYVEDAAEGVLLAAEHYDKSDPVNLGSGWEISIRELADTVSTLMEFKGEIRWDRAMPDGQLRRILDTTRAEREFGFRAETSFKEGLRKTIEWQRANPGALSPQS